MEMSVAVLVGVLSSLLAACLFLFGMLRLRPRIQISPYVAKHVGADGAATYWVQFTNRTRSPIVGVRFELTLIQELNIPGPKVSPRADVASHSLQRSPRPAPLPVRRL